MLEVQRCVLQLYYGNTSSSSYQGMTCVISVTQINQLYAATVVQKISIIICSVDKENCQDFLLERDSSSEYSLLQYQEENQR